MKTKSRIPLMMPVVIASIIMTGTLVSQTTAPKPAGIKQLKKHVEEAYYRYYTDPINISVNEAGVVELKGTVKTYWDRLNVFASIAKVKGVTKIVDDLVVQTEAAPDEIIRDEIMNQYSITRLISEPEKIKVAVTRGLVILTGSVNFYREASAAEDIAGTFKGVKSVDNELAVLPLAKAESDSNLTLIVQDVLKDQFSLGSKNVKVKVDQGVVALTGTVESLWMKQAVDKQLHSILGVKDVADNLMVNFNQM